MMKALNPTVHGVLDYALALAFLLLPRLLGFPDSAATLSYIIGAGYIVASLITRYPLGAFRILPFPVHGVLESIMAAAWVACPWLFGFASDGAARGFFVIAGIGLLIVAALTDYREESAQAAFSGGNRRHSAMERRHRTMPVARERRMGLPDRRGAAYAGA